MTSRKLSKPADLPDDLRPILADWLLAAADDVFLLGHRNSDWTGLAPMLEEDLAFSSIAQDEIAHAQAYYLLVSELTGQPPDKLAYGRSPVQYRCAHLVERTDDFDWARAVVRQFFYEHYGWLRLQRMVRSAYQPLAELSGKIAQEEKFHLEHLDDWAVRLGTGTDESRTRAQRAVDKLWPDALCLFEPVDGEQRLVEAAIFPSAGCDIRRAWFEEVSRVLDRAGLTVPSADGMDRSSCPPGGRRGVRSESFGELFAELAEVYRIEPDARW